MNLNLLARHSRLFSVFCASLSLSISLSIGLGSLKDSVDISWLDIIGEGSVALLSVSWILFLLISRPPGKVTTALVIGLSLFLFSACLDLVDEIFYYQNSAKYLSMFESIPSAFGMAVMSYALYQWHKEQLILNQQLQRRESSYRQHEQVDFITKLYDAQYMREQINGRLQDPNQHAFNLVMLDIDNFDYFNRQYGHEEGDRLLRDISELILMNLRSDDLACRYAGDRFILLLPNTSERTAIEIAEQVCKAIAHLAYRPNNSDCAVFHLVSYALESSQLDDKVAETILDRINKRIEKLKQPQLGVGI